MKQPVTAQDLQRLDPDFYRQRLQRLLAPGGADTFADLLGEPLNFMSAGNIWRSEPVPLVPGGERQIVTEENKHEYAVLLCDDFLVGSIRHELAAIMKGFWGLIPHSALRAAGLDEWDLQHLIGGQSSFDIADLRVKARCVGGSKGRVPQFAWFFNVVEDLMEEDRTRLLQFVTGSSRLPAEGLGALNPPFTLVVQPGGSNDQLPTSHTCANMICIPAYPTQEVLRAKLLTALQCESGFGFL